MNSQTEQAEIPTNFNDWREYRRFQAWRLYEQGWAQTKIADALDVTDGAVSQWLKTVREDGLSALRSNPDGGPKPRITEEELAQLPELLEQGPAAYGFRGEIWTRARVGEVIKQKFGVTYSDSHVGRLLAKINWTRQKPMEEPDRRDADAVAEWETETFPELKKKPHAKTAP